MGGKSPEQACEEYLSAKPSWLRKVLQCDYALTPEENAGMATVNWPEVYGQARDEYLELLRQCPDRLQEYRKLLKKQGAESAVVGVPSVPAGARRKDWLALEARELEQAGMSQPEIAAELNRRHPDLTDRKGNPRPITAEVVRHQLKTLRHRTSPEET
jgi:hypothetical protein